VPVAAADCVPTMMDAQGSATSPSINSRRELAYRNLRKFRAPATNLPSRGCGNTRAAARGSQATSDLPHTICILAVPALRRPRSRRHGTAQEVRVPDELVTQDRAHSPRAVGRKSVDFASTAAEKHRLVTGVDSRLYGFFFALSSDEEVLITQRSSRPPKATPPDVGPRPAADSPPKTFEKRLSEVSYFQEDRRRLEAKRSGTPLTCDMVL